MKIPVLFVILTFALVSCYEPNNENQGSKDQVTFNPKFDGLDAFLNYKEKVDQYKNLKSLPSLFYTHFSGYTLQSKVQLTGNNELIKANLEKMDTNGLQTIYSFYFLQEVLSMVTISKSNNKPAAPTQEQIIVFYSAAQNPIGAYRSTSHTQKAQNQGAKTFQSISVTKSLHHQIDQHLQYITEMQNQEGRFELYFQDFDEAFNKKFVQFGNNEFSTNLAFAPNEILIEELQKNPSLYTNKKFHIQHQQIQEASGLSYQVLVSIEKL